MSDQLEPEAPPPSLRLQPPQPHEFLRLQPGFEYPHDVSRASESNTPAFDAALDARDLGRCVVCGTEGADGPHPRVHRAHIIGSTEVKTWALLKHSGLVPGPAETAVHEPRNAVDLCALHHADFDGHRFFIRWVPAARKFVFVNFSRERYLEGFHGKTVALDPGHGHSPFPAPFLVQEMRTRGFYP
ncbi:hypothetical protein BJ138DRAFT_1105186, partial [Hygrophoropsis aurantiaca]